MSQAPKASAALRRAAAVLHSAANPILVTDAAGVLVAVNPAFTTVFGWSEPEVLGQRADDTLRSGLFSSSPAVRHAVAGEGSWHGEAILTASSGRQVTGWLTIAACRAEGAAPDGELVAVFTDVTPLMASEARLDHLARHDPLTGLASRLSLGEGLDDALRRSIQRRSRAAVLFLDLDRFKEVNDILGHTAGDEVLREVAARLRRAVRAGDLLVRLGGDEFLVVAEGLGAREEAAVVAQKLLDVVDAPVPALGSEVVLTASIGIAVFPDDAGDPDSLVRLADEAMYAVKEGGRAGFAFRRP